jgi:thioredoxin-related protein
MQVLCIPMYKITCFSVLFTCLSVLNWHYNLPEAIQIAKKEHRYILLNFSGSDWCGPCIRMRNEIFESEAFRQLADSALVLVNADFPRMKKNQLPAKQQGINNEIADRYNPQGRFPLTLILDADGKVLKEWEGFVNEPPAQFTSQVKGIMDANR